MNDIQATELLAERRQPALALLAAAIDREFERREPQHPTPYEHAAALLGVATTHLVVLDEGVTPAVAHSVGRWLFDAQARYAADHSGAYPSRPPASEVVPGATGDVRVFTAAGPWRTTRQDAGQYL